MQLDITCLVPLTMHMTTLPAFHRIRLIERYKSTIFCYRGNPKIMEGNQVTSATYCDNWIRLLSVTGNR